MSVPELVFRDPRSDGGGELVVNFGVFAGREATPAEIERLAAALLEQRAAVEIVCEQRYEFSRDAEATVYRVRVTAPGAPTGTAGLDDTVRDWAADCIGERRVTP